MISCDRENLAQVIRYVVRGKGKNRVGKGNESYGYDWINHRRFSEATTNFVPLMSGASRTRLGLVYANPHYYPTLSSEATSAIFQGQVVTFDNGSGWKITDSLSETKLLSAPPVETTQVYICKCLEDPGSAYGSFEQAVMKIKYQHVCVLCRATYLLKL